LALEMIEMIWSAKDKLQSTITPRSLTETRVGRTALPILTKLTSTNLELPDNSKLEHLGIERQICQFLDQSHKISIAHWVTLGLGR